MSSSLAGSVQRVCSKTSTGKVTPVDLARVILHFIDWAAAIMISGVCPLRPKGPAGWTKRRRRGENHSRNRLRFVPDGRECAEQVIVRGAH
jgi:hypothetical protein